MMRFHAKHPVNLSSLLANPVELLKLVGMIGLAGLVGPVGLWMLVGTLGLVCTSGCDIGNPPPGLRAEKTELTEKPEQPVSEKSEMVTPKVSPKTETKTKKIVKPPAASNYEATEAKVGDGAKGHNLKSGYLGTVVGAKFRSEERIRMIQWEHALQIYKASHGGNGPRSHKAFMKEVIQANKIQLPELTAGEFYRYDPQSGKLNVMRPKK